VAKHLPKWSQSGKRGQRLKIKKKKKKIKNCWAYASGGDEKTRILCVVSPTETFWGWGGEGAPAGVRGPVGGPGGTPIPESILEGGKRSFADQETLQTRRLGRLIPAGEGSGERKKKAWSGTKVVRIRPEEFTTVQQRGKTKGGGGLSLPVSHVGDGVGGCGGWKARRTTAWGRRKTRYTLQLLHLSTCHQTPTTKFLVRNSMRRVAGGTKI